MFNLNNYNKQSSAGKMLICLALTGVLIWVILPFSDKIKLMLSAFSFLFSFFIILKETKLKYPLALIVLVIYVSSASYELSTGNIQYNKISRVLWSVGNILNLAVMITIFYTKKTK